MAKTKPEVNGKASKAKATTVKDAGVTKSLQKPAAKAKELAKTTAAKVLPKEKSKKSKKVPEPEPESESDVSDSSEEDSDDSASEDEAPAPKTNGVKKVAPAADDDDSEDDSDDSEDDEEEEAAPAKTNGVKASKVNGTAKKPAADDDDDDSEDDSEDDESDSDDEAAPQAKAGAADDTSDESASSDEESDEEEAPVKTKANGVAKDDEEDDDEDSDDSDDSDEEEDEAPSKKRKADAVSTPASKKTKTEVTTPSAGEGVKNLFVGGLSWNIDEEWLAREFEEFGEVVGARIITDRESGRSKGYGYVEFAEADSAAKALEAKHESMIDGRQVRVDFSTPRQPRDQNTPRDFSNQRANKFGDQTGNPTDTLFCGNLSFDCTNEAVSEAFDEFGSITSVRLPTDRETGAPKGFGYISFSTVEEAQAALEAMNGQEIAGRRCRLDYAQPRAENGGGQRGGRGGFGDRGGRGGFGGRGRGGFGDRGGRGRGGARGGRGGGSTNRGGFGDFKGNKMSFD